MNPSVLSGLIVTALLHGGVAAGLVVFTGWGQDDGVRQPLNLIAIEASLAYKSPEPQPRQPQKQQAPRKAASPPKATEISRDETRKPERQETKKVEEEAEDFSKMFETFKNQRQTGAEEVVDEGPAQPQPPRGEFNGSERGFAEVSRGDPYMQELAAQVIGAWEVPTLETGEGKAIGCVRLAPDGSIMDTRLWEESKNANIDRSVQLALKRAQEQRKAGPAPVPRHLGDATNRWTCFNFLVKSP